MFVIGVYGIAILGLQVLTELGLRELMNGSPHGRTSRQEMKFANQLSMTYRGMLSLKYVVRKFRDRLLGKFGEVRQEDHDKRVCIG